MSVALPIPEPRADDDEDVHWALSTASALWARGESQEALKWLRRAAETASDANRDSRALELFKAAADFTGRIQATAATSTSSPPAIGSPPPALAQAAATPPPLPPLGSRPPPAPRAAPSTSPSSPRQSAGGPPTLPLSTLSPGQLEGAAATVAREALLPGTRGSNPPPRGPGSTGEAPRSAPPPPPRGRAGSSANIMATPTSSFPAIGRLPLLTPTSSEIGEERVEPMAPTVPGSQQRPAFSQRTGVADASPDRPFVARAATTPVAAGRGLDMKAARTLVSSPEQGHLQRAEQDAFRAAVAEAATTGTAQARELAGRAAGQLGSRGIRPTPSSVHPPSSAPASAAPTSAAPAPARVSDPEGASAAASAAAGSAPGAAALRVAATSAPSTTAAGRGAIKETPPASHLASQAGKVVAKPGDRGGPSSQRTPAKRRATLKRQGSTAASEPIIREGGRIPEPRRTQRFEEEITIVRDLSHLQNLQLASDLDDSTNVLSGHELDVEVSDPAAHQPEPPDGASADGDPPEAVTTELRAAHPGASVLDVLAGGIEADVSSRTPMAGDNVSEAARRERLSGAPGALSAFRIALAIDAGSGRVDAILLAPGEQAPTGRVAAIVLATDPGSSSALTELFTSSLRTGGRG